MIMEINILVTLSVYGFFVCFVSNQFVQPRSGNGLATISSYIHELTFKLLYFCALYRGGFKYISESDRII